MRAYIMAIAVSAVVSAVINIISPDKWQKYTSVITGLVMVVCIGRPIFELMHSDIFSGFNIEASTAASEGDKQLRAELERGLKTRVEADVKARVKQEFGREVEVSVKVGMNNDGQISGIDSIVIYGRGLDNAVIGRLREIYGAKEVKIGGSEKVSEKSE